MSDFQNNKLVFFGDQFKASAEESVINISVRFMGVRISCIILNTSGTL